MAQNLRLEKVEHQIKREVAAALAQKVADPAVAAVTVLRARVSKDLSYANIYISVLGDDEQRARSMEALDRCRPIIQQNVAARIRLRRTPHIRFQLDKEYLSAIRVLEILKGLEADGPNPTDDENSGDR